MDEIAVSIGVCSVAGALLFYAAGRLWPRRAETSPDADEQAKREALARQEATAVFARERVRIPIEEALAMNSAARVEADAGVAAPLEVPRAISEAPKPPEAPEVSDGDRLSPTDLEATLRMGDHDGSGSDGREKALRAALADLIETS